MWALGCVPWAARRKASERGPAPLPSPRCGGLSLRRTLRCPRGFGEGPSPRHSRGGFRPRRRRKAAWGARPASPPGVDARPPRQQRVADILSPRGPRGHWSLFII